MGRKEDAQSAKPRRRKIVQILIAIDDSKDAQFIFAEAAQIATKLEADVTILSVVKTPGGLGASGGEIDPGMITSEEESFLSLHKNLIKEHFTPSAVLIESKVLHGGPADKICEYAEKTKANMVIVGTRGRGRFAATMLGSVSEKVAHNCKCSVLIVKRPSQQ